MKVEEYKKEVVAYAEKPNWAKVFAALRMVWVYLKDVWNRKPIIVDDPRLVLINRNIELSKTLDWAIQGISAYEKLLKYGTDTPLLTHAKESRKMNGAEAEL